MFSQWQLFRKNILCWHQHQFIINKFNNTNNLPADTGTQMHLNRCSLFKKMICSAIKGLLLLLITSHVLQNMNSLLIIINNNITWLMGLPVWRTLRQLLPVQQVFEASIRRPIYTSQFGHHQSRDGVSLPRQRQPAEWRTERVFTVTITEAQM